MKTLVIGLDCAVPELLFGDERLTNIRRLMGGGCHGRLETIIPPITVPAWMCMATSQDPGSLGIYGFRNRKDHSYDGLSIVNSKSIQDLAIWDQVAREGKRANIIGVPPSFPPRKVNGVCVGCFMTPDTSKDNYTHPPAVRNEIASLTGEYPVDVKGFRTDQKDWLKDEIYSTSRKQFEVVRHLMQNSDWDYMQFVQICLDRLQHGFWKFHDSEHVLHVPGNPYEEVIRDYYLYLDDEIGTILDLLTDDTAILVMSDHGVQPVGMDELLQRSDIISMHAPGTKDAHHLMKEQHFRKMKKTALFVNTGRGSTVDEAAMIKALQEGWIAGAGLDVMETEPIGHNNPMLGMDNVTLTAHVASASNRFDTARKRRVGAELALVLSGKWPRACVNPAILEKSKLCLLYTSPSPRD